MRQRIILLAHNIRSLWNVGSLFRTCDAFGVEKLVLTGYTATPPRKEISKTALGAEQWVDWGHVNDPLDAMGEFRKKGYRMVALEQTEDAIKLSAYKAPAKVCVIIGNEILGVPMDIIEHCDDVVHIPMRGKKESLNVAVAAGVVLHSLVNSELSNVANR